MEKGEPGRFERFSNSLDPKGLTFTRMLTYSNERSYAFQRPIRTITSAPPDAWYRNGVHSITYACPGDPLVPRRVPPLAPRYIRYTPHKFRGLKNHV